MSNHGQGKTGSQGAFRAIARPFSRKALAVLNEKKKCKYCVNMTSGISGVCRSCRMAYLKEIGFIKLRNRNAKLINLWQKGYDLDYMSRITGLSTERIFMILEEELSEI